MSRYGIAPAGGALGGVRFFWRIPQVAVIAVQTERPAAALTIFRMIAADLVLAGGAAGEGGTRAALGLTSHVLHPLSTIGPASPGGNLAPDEGNARAIGYNSLPKSELIEEAMKRIAILIGMLMVWSAAMAQTAAKTAAKTVYVKCGALIDGKSEQARRNVVVAVEGDKIVAVGAAQGGAELIDLSHETCLPGLIDTHTHVLLQGDITAEDYDKQLLKESTPYRTILATQAARKALEYGFTAIRDVETEGAGYADVDLKKAINAGVIPGPRMQVATRALDVTGAYPLLGYSWELMANALARWI